MASRKENYGMFKQLVSDFIDADIPAAEITYSEDDISKNFKPFMITGKLNQVIKRAGYKDIIKAITIDGKNYILNQSLIEEA